MKNVKKIFLTSFLLCFIVASSFGRCECYNEAKNEGFAYEGTCCNPTGKYGSTFHYAYDSDSRTWVKITRSIELTQAFCCN
jgi:hypothetical protein